MDKFIMWWHNNHPFKSKYLAVRIAWFTLAVTLGTLIYIVASIGTSCIHFYEEMRDWFSDVKNNYFKLFNKGK